MRDMIIMKKVNLIAFVIASFAFFGCDEGCEIVNDNFENGKCSQNIKTSVSKVSSEKSEVIDGKYSLVCDATKSKDSTVAFRVESDKFNVLEITFDYKVLKGCYKNDAPSINFYSEDENGKLVLCSQRDRGRSKTFTTFPNAVVNVNATFHGYYGKKCVVEVQMRGYAKLAFDNIKVSGYLADKKGDWSVKFAKEFSSCRCNPFIDHYLRPTDKYLSMSKDEFFPFIDKYGQFKHRDFVGRVYSDEDLKKQIEEENNWYKANPRIANRDEFYGLIDPKHKYEATGRFRTQKIDGKWYLITPEGNLYLALGVCLYGLGERFDNPTNSADEFKIGSNYWSGNVTPFQWREHFFEDVSNRRYVTKSTLFKRAYYFDKNAPADSYDFYGSNLEKKYGVGVPNKLTLMRKRADSFGINLGGHLSDAKSLKAAKVPYTVTLESTSRFQVDVIELNGKYNLGGWWQKPSDWFDPNFEPMLRKKVANLADLIRSPYCVGVLIDGELPWIEDENRLLKGVISCDEKQPAKIVLRDMLRTKYGTIEKLNVAWKSDYKSWEDFMKSTKLPLEKTSNADAIAFHEKYIHRYFSVCQKAIKDIDSKALYLGCYFGGSHWGRPAAISTYYCDVVSITTYRYGLTGFELPKNALVDRPILIGEWHFVPQDEGTFGYTMIPTVSRDNQCKLVEDFMKTIITNPNIVGAVWFQWEDIPTTGRYDKADSGVGLISIADRPHYKLVETFRKISEKMYNMRFNTKIDKNAKSLKDDRNWH